jgi:hypothetical protein
MDPTPDDLNGLPEDEAERLLDLLREQEWETSPDFAAKVHRKIERRTAASHYVSFSWNMSKAVLVELAGLLKHLAVNVDGKKEPRS